MLSCIAVGIISQDGMGMHSYGGVGIHFSADADDTSVVNSGPVVCK